MCTYKHLLMYHKHQKKGNVRITEHSGTFTLQLLLWKSSKYYTVFPLATEPGISLIILTPMKILQEYVR